jgi:hypothetical protein
MLSNPSIPEAVKTASRVATLAAPNFLSYLFRAALSGASMRAVAPNYRYWRRAGSAWPAEYERRKTRHPYYHIQEMMITDHVAHHAPRRVLEWGCGTGRHLHNLTQLPEVEALGFDQSETIVDAGFATGGIPQVLGTMSGISGSVLNMCCWVESCERSRALCRRSVAFCTAPAG